MYQKELPSKEILENSIRKWNEELRGLSINATIIFREGDYPRVELPATDFLGFWNHYLAGSLIAPAVEESSFAEYKKIKPNTSKIEDFQRKALALVNNWAKERPLTPLEQESCEAFLRASVSFPWATNSVLLKNLLNIVDELGNDYSMLINRKRLIGFD